MKPFDGIARITSTVATKSVLNPTLLLAAIVVPICVIVGSQMNGISQLILLLTATAVVVVALLQIVGFSLFSPLHLQDNCHVEERLRIEHAVRFGDVNGEIIIDTTARSVNNPAIEDQRNV